MIIKCETIFPLEGCGGVVPERDKTDTPETPTAPPADAGQNP